MALTMQVEGIEELSRKLTALGDKAEEVASRALYDGAGVMANAYRNAAASVRAQPFRYAVFKKRDPSFEEKAAIQGQTGIARFDKNGSEVQTSIGFSGSGYVTIAGKQKAVRKIANAINSGTSFMNKQPVFRKAATQTAPAASAAIVAKAEKLIDEITK